MGDYEWRDDIPDFKDAGRKVICFDVSNTPFVGTLCNDWPRDDEDEHGEWSVFSAHGVEKWLSDFDKWAFLT